MNLHNSPQPEPAAGPGLRQTSWIYRVFQYGFALWAGLLFCVCLRWHNNPFLSLGRVQLAIMSLLCAGVLYALFRFWERVIPVPRHPRRTALVLLTVYGILLVAFGLLMQVKFGPSWDFPVVASEAAAFVLEGTPPGTYFILGISNAPLYWVHVGCFRLLYTLGVRDLMPGLVLLNCACILISLYLFYRAAALIWDEKRALFVLCCAFLYPGLFLYAPIAYTDTLSLPFVSGAVRVDRRGSSPRAALCRRRMLCNRARRRFEGLGRRARRRLCDRSCPSLDGTHPVVRFGRLGRLLSRGTLWRHPAQPHRLSGI